MRILICGDRNWTDFLTIYTVLQEYQQVAEAVIHGAARGADTLGAQAAEALQIPIDPPGGYPADWDTYGNAGGPIRNRYMLKAGKPDLVLAFHNDLDTSKGTKDMVTIARKAGIKTIVINDRGEKQEQPTLF